MVYDIYNEKVKSKFERDGDLN